jgi:hypothetical protein
MAAMAGGSILVSYLLVFFTGGVATEAKNCHITRDSDNIH